MTKSNATVVSYGSLRTQITEEVRAIGEEIARLNNDGGSKVEQFMGARHELLGVMSASMAYFGHIEVDAALSDLRVAFDLLKATFSATIYDDPANEWQRFCTQSARLKRMVNDMSQRGQGSLASAVVGHISDHTAFTKATMSWRAPTPPAYPGRSDNRSVHELGGR